MNKSFAFLIERPKNFDVKQFEKTFIKGMKKLGVNICSIKQWKQYGIELEGDTLNFEFDTDIDFGVKDKDLFVVGIIYEKIIEIKKEYNAKDENKIKIGPIILVNY